MLNSLQEVVFPEQPSCLYTTVREDLVGHYFSDLGGSILVANIVQVCFSAGHVSERAGSGGVFAIPLPFATFGIGEGLWRHD